MAVSITYDNIINLTSNGVSFKTEDTIIDNTNIYYINCYINSILKFRLKYTVKQTRDNEFNNLIDDMVNGVINIDLSYTGEVVR